MIFGLDPYAQDGLDLLLRWLHVIAGIAWVGSSFYFVFVDNHLLPPESREDEAKGVSGELWAVHGGGFYHVQKYRTAPRRLPEPLHFFKWEAYTTWLSGFALLTVLYYVDADLLLIDRSVADLSEAAAIAISIGLLAAAWLVYDGLCRLLGASEGLLALVVGGLAVLAAWGTSELFAARAAYLQVGAMLGTIMAGNVLFSIIPAHKGLVRAKQAGEEPDRAPLLQAKQRSVHNNYFTLPVVFTMIAGHAPFTFGHDHGWLVLVALMAIGAWVRHFFNLRHGGRTVLAIPVTAAAALIALAWAIEPDEAPPAAGPPVTVSEVQPIVEARCQPCHSESPTQTGVTSPPAGLVLDTTEQIEARAAAIEEQVRAGAMPPGNVTGLTDEERDRLLAWAAAEAQ
jgi:uncharacterized membrane protein